jgi:hypothetical protein
MTNNLVKAIDGALTEAAEHETVIRRAEDSLTEAITQKLIETIAARDLVTEADKLGCASLGLSLSAAAIDALSKGFGKYQAGLPRHVMADFLKSDANRTWLMNAVTKKVVEDTDTMAMRRVNKRAGFTSSATPDIERKNTQPKDGGMSYGTLPPTVTTSGPMAQPVEAKKHPVLPGEQYHKPTTKHDGELSGPIVGGGRYPASKKGKR